MELPYINGKTVKTIETIDYNGDIEEVRITFTDGSILVFTGSYNSNHREGYINLRLETAAIETQQPAHKPLAVPLGDHAAVTARSEWPGER